MKNNTLPTELKNLHSFSFMYLTLGAMLFVFFCIVYRKMQIKPPSFNRNRIHLKIDCNFYTFQFSFMYLTLGAMLFVYRKMLIKPPSFNRNRIHLKIDCNFYTHICTVPNSFVSIFLHVSHTWSNVIRL